jgi:RNA polymerase sigma-70 factor (ECF subfamily)
MVLDTNDLLRQSLAGDRDALGRLLEKYKPYLTALAKRYLDNRVYGRLDAGDVVQITYLEATRDFESFRGTEIASLLAWLRHILRNNVSTAHQRHLATQKRSANFEVRGNVTNSSGNLLPLVNVLPSETSSPSQRVMRDEAAASLAEAMLKLPETQSEALRLRYLEGLPLTEIAERLEKSTDAVAGLLKRGLRSLRQDLIQT